MTVKRRSFRLRQRQDPSVIPGLYALLRDPELREAHDYISAMVRYAEIGKDRKKLGPEYVAMVAGAAKANAQFAREMDEALRQGSEMDNQDPATYAFTGACRNCEHTFQVTLPRGTATSDAGIVCEACGCASGVYWVGPPETGVPQPGGELGRRIAGAERNA